MKEGDKCHYQPAIASLLRLGKNMSTATEKITESPKRNQLTMSKHSKKFAFRLEKYNNN